MSENVDMYLNKEEKESISGLVSYDLKFDSPFVPTEVTVL